MKERQIMTGLACLVFLFMSCSHKKDNEPEPPKPPEPPEVKTEQVVILAKSPDAETKTELAEDGVSLRWSKGDEITVFMSSPIDDKLHSAEYTIDDNTVSVGIPMFKGELFWQKEGEDHTFYSCYPVITGCEDVKKLPVALPAEQTQTGASSAHLAQLDILVAATVTQKAPGTFTNSFTSVPVFYRHIFAFIEVRFYSKTPNIRVDKVVMTSIKANLSLTEGVVDMSLPVSDPMHCRISEIKGENAVTLSIQEPDEVPVLTTGNPTLENTLPAFFAVCPGDHTGGEISFMVETTDGKMYEFKRSGRPINPADKLIVYLEL